LILAAIDPCYSCTDRVVVVDAKDESIKLVPLDEIRIQANKDYANKPRRVA